MDRSITFPPGPTTPSPRSNKYVEFAWKHSFGDNSFLQVSPYWKQSNVVFTNDLANDLAAAQDDANASALGGITSDSFSENRTSDNLGMQVDYTLRADDHNLIKAGAQALWTQSTGPVQSLRSATTAAAR